MNIEDFNNLSDDEKTVILSAVDTNEKVIQDLTAERDSLREELTSTQKVLGDTKTELAETKKVNFTLARQTAIKKPEDPETLLFNMFGGVKT